MDSPSPAPLNLISCLVGSSPRAACLNPLQDSTSLLKGGITDRSQIIEDKLFVTAPRLLGSHFCPGSSVFRPRNQPGVGVGANPGELPNYRTDLPVFESFLPAPPPPLVPSPREITLKGPNGTMSSSLPLSSLPPSLSFFFLLAFVEFIPKLS